MDWKDFRQLFNERYYCDAAQTAKMNEFMNLVQGNTTVTEYDNVDAKNQPTKKSPVHGENTRLKVT